MVDVRTYKVTVCWPSIRRLLYISSLRSLTHIADIIRIPGSPSIVYSRAFIGHNTAVRETRYNRVKYVAYGYDDLTSSHRTQHHLHTTYDTPKHYIWHQQNMHDTPPHYTRHTISLCTTHRHTTHDTPPHYLRHTISIHYTYGTPPHFARHTTAPSTTHHRTIHDTPQHYTQHTTTIHDTPPRRKRHATILYVRHTTTQL